jgi:hypothetical protein
MPMASASASVSAAPLAAEVVEEPQPDATLRLHIEAAKAAAPAGWSGTDIRLVSGAKAAVVTFGYPGDGGNRRAVAVVDGDALGTYHMTEGYELDVRIEHVSMVPYALIYELTLSPARVVAAFELSGRIWRPVAPDSLGDAALRP